MSLLARPAAPVAEPPRAARKRRPIGWDGWTWVVVGLFAAAALLVFADFGITWDEDVQIVYGEYVLRWYLSGFHDRSALEYLNLYYYGGFFDGLAQALYRVSPFALYPTRHLLGGLFAAAGVLGTARLARELDGPRAGFLAALFLALTPLFFGHAFVNPKDAPFAVLHVWAIYALVRAIRHYPRVPWRVVAGLGVAAGLAMGVRIGGVLVLCYTALSAAAWLALVLRRAGWSAIRAALVPLAVRLLAACATAYGVMLVCWPWAQTGPLHHPLLALRESTRFGWAGTVLFEGTVYPAAGLPRRYVTELLLLTLPEYLLLGAAVALVRAGFGIGAMGRRGQAAKAGESLSAEPRGEDSGDATVSIPAGTAWVRWLVVWTCIVFPIAYAALKGAVLYDNQRHFLFVIPPLAAAAAGAFDWVWRRASRPVTVLVGVPALAALLLAAFDLATLHPHQYAYFNRALAGGMTGASGRYELDYWGNSYREGAEWLAASWPSRPGAPRLRVASCSNPSSTAGFLPQDRFEYVGSIEFGVSAPPEVVLATTRFDCHRRMPGRVLHVVQRHGAPLLYVTDVRGRR